MPPSPAWLSYAFICIRRYAEVLSLELRGAVEADDAMQLRVRRQKNDSLDKGMLCCLPALPALGALCPLLLTRRWLTQRKATCDTAPEGPLFCVTGRADLRPVSYDTVRRSLARAMRDRDVGTHSFWKGARTGGGRPQA